MLDNPSVGRPALLVTLVVLAVSTSGCAAILEAGVKAAVGDDAPNGFADAGESGGFADDSGPRAVADGREMPGPRIDGVTSVYQDAPTPDWEGNLRPAPSAARSEHFEAHLFDGQCPGLDLLLDREDDPFGSVETQSGGWFSVSTSHYQWGQWSLFDPIPPGGMAPQAQFVEQFDIYGLPGDGCNVRFLPLVRFGSSTPTAVAK